MIYIGVGSGWKDEYEWLDMEISSEGKVYALNL